MLRKKRKPLLYPNALKERKRGEREGGRGKRERDGERLTRPVVPDWHICSTAQTMSHLLNVELVQGQMRWD